MYISILFNLLCSILNKSIALRSFPGHEFQSFSFGPVPGTPGSRSNPGNFENNFSYSFYKVHIPWGRTLTLRRPNLIGAHVPVAPDLAKTVKAGSDHSEKLTSVLNSARNGELRFKNFQIYLKLINFSLVLLRKADNAEP